MEDNKKERVSNWLRENKEFITLSALEQKIGAPSATLQKVTKSDRGLADQWVEPLYELLREMKINV